MEQYADKYTGGASQGGSQGGQGGDYQQYMNQYSGKYMNGGEHKGDKAASGGAEALTELVAEPAATHSSNRQSKHASNAEDCTTLEELHKWRSQKVAKLEKYVPKEYQKYAKKSIDQEFDDNAARITKAQKAPADAAA